MTSQGLNDEHVVLVNNLDPKPTIYFLIFAFACLLIMGIALELIDASTPPHIPGLGIAISLMLMILVGIRIGYVRFALTPKSIIVGHEGIEIKKGFGKARHYVWKDVKAVGFNEGWDYLLPRDWARMSYVYVSKQGRVRRYEMDYSLGTTLMEKSSSYGIQLVKSNVR